MSVNYIAKVWALEIPSTPKLVLLSLADQANDKGICWPSQPYIARRCSLSDRAVRVQLTYLEDAKVIRRNVRAGVGTTFTLTLPDADEPRNDVPPRNNIPPRNDVPATPEQYSGHPGTTFRQTVSKHKEPSVEGGKPPAVDEGKKSSVMKGSRLPADWKLPKAWGEWALAEVPGWSADQIRKVGEKFGDYWLGKAGKDAVKADWLATWRNWVRREAERNNSATSRSPAPSTPDPFRGCI